MYNKILETYEQTEIWKIYGTKASSDQQEFVKKIVGFAVPLLKKYSDTFPRYTEHSGKHQVNILNLISNLLGERLNDLSVLECAILILSTFLHDIGMVFNEDERNELDREADFQKFINENPQANLDYLKNEKKVSQDLAEWFCRWSHASRVYVYLKTIDKGNVDGVSLKWQNKTSLHTKLGLVCESHNWTTVRIKESEFDTLFLGDADLRLCAILLRLGDILDFDDTRTEESIFKYYLKLDKAKYGATNYSRKEWEKHLCSSGFQFPIADRREKPYDIRFIASPEHPETEVGVNEFLDYIDTEIRKCREILPFCSEKWRNLQLPNTIKREIHSQNYKSGAFNFTLDQKQVLNLLMGENLYKDTYVCIRELLQNAIDTSRHREFYERSKGRTEFKAQPIKVSEWEDADGYQWIRFDDFGMGMNEKIIRNYFLKVGNSYYNSPEFEAEKIGYKKNNVDFTPISRFGIGILSCFLIADKVEVSSYKDNFSPLRLSIEGINNYYILKIKDEKHYADNFPSEFQNEEYRNEIGTSIAIRIDSLKENIYFNLEATLKKWLFCPSVSVEFKGGNIGENPVLLDKPLFEPFADYISNEEHQIVEEFFGKKLEGKIGLEYIPYNLTEESRDSKLKGQLIVIRIVAPKLIYSEADEHAFENKVKINHWQLYYNRFDEEEAEDLSLIFEKLVKDEKGELKTIEYRVKLFSFNEFCKKIHSTFFSFKTEMNNSGGNIFNKILISHNGIYCSQIEVDRSLYVKNNRIIFGVISLFDELRPNMQVSRNEKLEFGFEIKNAIQIATNKLWKNHFLLKKYNHFNFELFDSRLGYLKFSEISIRKIINSKYLDFWKEELVFEVDNQLLSFIDVKGLLHQGSQHLKIGFIGYDNVRLKIYNAILQSEFNIVYNINKDLKGSQLLILDAAKPILPEGLTYFYGLFFVKFMGSDKLLYNMSFNQNHPFSTWLIDSYTFISLNHEGYLLKILTHLGDLKYTFGLKRDSISKLIISINKVLTRIQSVISTDSKHFPNPSIFLKNDDFYYEEG